MSCNKIQSQLSAYVDGEMSGLDMQAFRSHVVSCEACQQELDGFRSVRSVLRDLPPTPEPSAILVEKIQSRIADSRPNYLRLGLVVAVPALCFAIFAFTRPNHEKKIEDRSLAINRQLAKDQIFDSGSDPMAGASLVHYTNFETP